MKLLQRRRDYRTDLLNRVRQEWKHAYPDINWVIYEDTHGAIHDLLFEIRWAIREELVG